MSVNNNAKRDPTVRRNLHRKDVNLSPLHLPSLLGITMGVLMFMAMAAPSAHATLHLLTYYNFNTAGTIPYTSNSPGEQTTHLINDATNPFPSSQLAIDASGGTTLNQWPADATGAGGKLDLMGNANLNAGSLYCLDFGGISTVDHKIVRGMDQGTAQYHHGSQNSKNFLHFLPPCLCIRQLIRENVSNSKSACKALLNIST